MKIKLVFLIFLLLIYSCKSEEDSAEKTVHVNDTDITLSTHYSKFYMLDIVALPHVPIVLPGTKKEKTLYTAIHIEGKEDFVIESILDDQLLDDPDKIQKTLSATEVLLSPDMVNLVYRRKRKDKDTLIHVQYLEDKHPYICTYYKEDIKKSKPNWKKIADPYTIADKIIKDTTNADYYRGEIYFKTYESLFWDALKKLKPENELDYKVLENLYAKNYNGEHIVYLCKDWDQRSEKWKKAIRARIRNSYQSFTRSQNEDKFLRETNLITAILEVSNDETIKKEYYQFIIANFDKGIRGALESRIQFDTIFAKQYRDRIVDRCEEVLQTNNPKKIEDVRFVAIFLKDSILLQKALDKEKSL